jgi:hypothetical protein
VRLVVVLKKNSLGEERGRMRMMSGRLKKSSRGRSKGRKSKKMAKKRKGRSPQPPIRRE